jgi:probable HAF family extracellular repeat protein
VLFRPAAVQLGARHGPAALADFSAYRAFLYSDGAMRDIGSLGGAFTEARALNEAGMVVGYSTYADDVPGFDFSSAFLYRDGTMFDVNLLIDRPGEWTVTDAAGINDAGQIAAYACTAFGDCREVRLDPIPAIPEPQPAALWLAGVTGLSVAAASRRRAGRGASAACRCA